MKDGVATMPAVILPGSALLLGIVCDALRLTLPRNRKESGRRFLTGERMLTEEARIAVVRSLVEDALKLGYLGDDAAAAVKQERDRWVELVTSGVIILMRRWDHAIGHMAAAQLPQLERKVLVTACLRAAIVDVAIRAAAFRMVARLPLMSPAAKTITFTEVPSWARSGGAVAGLAFRVKERGLTRDALHSTNALDDWLGGRRRPTPESLQKIAPQLAGGEAAGLWLHHLLWDFGLAYIADAVRAAVGDESVDDLAAALRRLVHLCIYPMASLPHEHRETVLLELVRWGALAPIARGLCEELQQQEGLAMRVEWARALALGGRPWSLLWLVASLPAVPEPPSDPTIPEELIERLSRLIREPTRGADELLAICQGHPGLFLWLMRMVIHHGVTAGDLDIAAPLMGKLADAVGGPMLHLEAATLLAGADQHDESARHLAAIPNNDSLRGAADVLEAITHIMTGRHQEALEALDQLEDDGPAVLRVRAEALLGLGQASAALDLVEKVISSVPLDAVALELAARCCTALGRTRHATRYSKAAHRLGRPQAPPTGSKRRPSQRA